ncbi:hypothetical protein ACIQNU_19995 [Streptomyces sp. NPDC091292]|uniref:hypothetical protein n=1 Tax=Streptomyces sp. NPDC091292 TaxID=3365991 RepID=UPI0037F7CC74
MTNHLRIPRPRLTSPVVATAVLAASMTLVPLAMQDAPAEASQAHTNTLFTEPVKALGSSYEASGDSVVSGTGDTDGFHIMAAEEQDGFAFREVARLTRKDLDVGPWTGYVCTTGSGRYAAAVYMPSMWTNKPGATYRGAFAAVVRLADGKVTEVAEGVQLSYFSPGCGTGDRVLFSSSSATDSDAGKTTVIEADAATGWITKDRTVKGRLTHLLPTDRGDFGVLNGNLVQLTGAGKSVKAEKETKLPGPVFALTSSADGALDLGTVQKKKSVITRWHGGKLTTLGSGPVGSVKLFPRKGGDLVVGDVEAIDTTAAPGLKAQKFDGRPVGVSREGHLVTTSVFSDGMKGITPKLGSPSREGAGTIRIKATAVRTGSQASAAVETGAAQAPAPAPAPGKASGKDAPSPALDPAAFAAADPDDTDPRTCGEGSPESLCLSGTGVPVYGSVLGFEIPCLVKRNDPKRQALQPSANQVEWAVDQAVHGYLTKQRPADWHDTGLPAYSPQGLFPKPALSGGGDIPAQVVLGILAQESNFKQASWHSVNGTAGNPLQADWFGNGASIHTYPDRGKSDCGYGIGQVTTGMSDMHPEQFNTTEAGAIATDYASNLAAGMEILAEKWNQLGALGMKVNSGDPQYIENWYMALWGYNSGVYTDPNNKRGLGYFNNPANPSYSPDRDGFLRASYDDASHPADWPYQEKVLGWAETPHKTWNWEASYAIPHTPFEYGDINIPSDYYQFCAPGVNSCTPGAADPCPSWDNACRWDASSSWISGGQNASNSSTERLMYELGSGEPPLDRKYPEGPCLKRPNDNYSAIIVDDLAEHENTYDCGDFEAADDGKFSLQLGDNLTHYRSNQTFRATPYIAQIDLHQLGAGYDGHSFFTHSYPESDFFHKVTARWEMNPKSLHASNDIGSRFNVWVHLPNHGAEAIVRYSVIPGRNDSGFTTHTCRLNQKTRSNGQDTWVELGTMQFWKGGRVEADNLHDAGTGDANVNFDAVAFVPTSIPSNGVCGFGY